MLVRILLLFCCCAIHRPVYSSNLPYFYFSLPPETLELIQYLIRDDPVIIDAGAFDGNESVLMANMWPNGTVHAFEPVPYLYHKVVANSKGTPNIIPYNFALSSVNGMASLHLAVNDDAPTIPVMSSSLLPPQYHHLLSPEVIFPTTIPVFTYTLDSWAEAFNIDRVDLMWLDMQGVELDVLLASPKILKTTSVIVIEVEFEQVYKGQYLYQDIKTFLEDNGFVLIGGNFNPENPRINGAFFGDALFVRSEYLFNND